MVSSSPTESLLLTSYATVAALTAKPAPALTLEKGVESFAAELWAWDADHDLALLKTTRGGLPQLEWAPDAERVVQNVDGANGHVHRPGLPWLYGNGSCGHVHPE